jgi:hypothetical protein
MKWALGAIIPISKDFFDFFQQERPTRTEFKTHFLTKTAPIHENPRSATAMGSSRRTISFPEN